MSINVFDLPFLQPKAILASTEDVCGNVKNSLACWLDIAAV
jgi:hypothetical protein